MSSTVCASASASASASAAARAAEEAGEEEEDDRTFSGEKEWFFRKRALVVRTFEDFLEAAIGGVITRASEDLARWVSEDCPENHWQGRHCIELGSGCGLVSSTLLKLRASVVATDLEQLLPHLKWNLGLNADKDSERNSVEALEWGDESARKALRQKVGEAGAAGVFAANCVYSHEAVTPFLEAVHSISGSETLALMCGIPVPPASKVKQDGEGDTACFIDSFLATVPEYFDCHLVAVPGGAEKSGRADKEASAVYPDGIASSLAQAHGLTAGALADGIWLLKLPGNAPPSWIKPLLTLQARGVADS
ncbi:unnamed protein product [Polarella glacialis]|uniref:Calmodulin-lysine N-methyltransferase n=1 Tax=Polarella glacialis TaxID=89957 RepID=A0A813FCG6_POLGL|nr:unnamed protein product [Polarella glacialis]